LAAPTTSRVFRADPRLLDDRERHRRGSFSVCYLPEAVLVTVEGEVDATNARALPRFVEQRIAGSARLVVDLYSVQFFGTAGFAALHNINVNCRRLGVAWALRPGPRAGRILEICDTNHVLPVL
jgi:anti-anti-sigma factor